MRWVLFDFLRIFFKVYEKTPTLVVSKFFYRYRKKLARGNRKREGGVGPSI